ncbi:AAA family ATPase [uncultured virus]|nr:AAA family ATPase [uncultured virus]
MSLSNATKALVIASASMTLPHLIPDIKIVAIKLFGAVCDLIFSTIVIKHRQYQSFHAMKQALPSILGHTNTRDVTDEGDKPSYKPTYGTYHRRVEIKGHGTKHLIICYQEEKITVCACGPMKPLTAFFNAIYAKHNGPELSVSYYSIKDDEWSHPKFRKPRLVGATSITPSMQCVLDSVNVFKSNEKDYELDNMHFRIGFMLHGGPGTGKSSLAEIIATRYNMGVYTIQLNNKNMTDGTLINLCHNVPVNSVIVFDEIDKQFDAVINNDTVHISKSGILGSVDGVPKLPHGTIVIMTANRLDGFDEEFRGQLFREGRIDNVMELTQQFH